MDRWSLARYALHQAMKKLGIVGYPTDEMVDDFLLEVDSKPETKRLEQELIDLNRQIRELEEQRRQMLLKEDDLLKQLGVETKNAQTEE